jgi:hypothetical protein
MAVEWSKPFNKMMKSAGLLKLSLVLNLALGVVWFAIASRKAPAETAPPSSPKSAAPAFVSATQTNTAAPPVEAVSPLTKKFDWSRVESTDFRQYTANLRNIHCPERLVREIIIAAIHKHYEEQESEVNEKPAISEPWDGADARAAANRKRVAQGKALWQEEVALIKELFGVDWNVKASEVGDEDVIVGFLLGFLPNEKAMQTVAVAMSSDDAASDIRRDADGILIAADFAKLRQVADEQMTRLGEILTPVELDELRHRVQVFSLDHGDIHFEGVTLSGPEMRKIAGFTLGINDFLRDELIVKDDVSDEEKTNRRVVFDQQVANLLDPQRYADYQIAQDGNFRNAFQFTANHSLPKSDAVKMADAVRSADAQAQEIREDQSLSADEKKLALQVLQTTVQDQLSGVLGSAFSDYETNNGAGLRYVPPDKVKGRAQ